MRIMFIKVLFNIIMDNGLHGDSCRCSRGHMIVNLTALGLMMNNYYGHCKSSLTKQFAVVSQVSCQNRSKQILVVVFTCVSN